MSEEFIKVTDRQTDRQTHGQSYFLSSYRSLKEQIFFKLYVVFSWLQSIKDLPSFSPSQSAGGGIWDADAEYLSMSGGCQIWSPGYLVTDSRPDICVTTRSVTPAYISITPATCASYTINQKLHKTLICLFFSWSLHKKCTRNTIFIQV